MRSRILWIGALLVGAASFACSGDSEGPDPDLETGTPIEVDAVAADLAGLMCDAQASCDCESLPAPADCAEALTPAVARLVARAEVLGLRFYEECVGLAAGHLAALGCRRFDETIGDSELANLAFEAAHCKPLAGVDGIADPCSAVPGDLGPAFLGDSCAPGLVCIEGTCARLIAEVGDVCADSAVCPAGTACLDPDGSGAATCQAPAGQDERCNPHDLDPCEADLLCDREAGVCNPPPGPGEVCPQGVCAAGSRCDGSTCELLPGPGDECGTLGCAEDLTCDFDTATCTPLPIAGEPCFQGSCASNRRCGPEGVCVDDPPMTCELPFCLYRADGLCDEPEGTGLCADETDPEDCGIGLSRVSSRGAAR
jgi:hypothetical protein